MNNTIKFNGKADTYAIARPTYPAEFIDYLYNKTGFSDESIIADIGAGTGILTKLLLERGSSVFAVEPNNDMRSKAGMLIKDYDKLIIVDGTAEDTTLGDNSMDFITVAQAFHWFDVDMFKKECKRIIKKNGIVVLVWNNRVEESPIVKDSAEIFKKYCANFNGFSGSRISKNDNINRFFDNKNDVVEFENDLKFDCDGFINRSLSSSYSLSKDDKMFDRYLAELKDLFYKYADNGILTMPNKTTAYIGGM